MKCLVDCRRLFIETSDERYVLNDLYIDDYCVWTQHIRYNLCHLNSLTAVCQQVSKNTDKVHTKQTVTVRRGL